jgi:redox-sensitive bicupin YhaK (pirin superfamily)
MSHRYDIMLPRMFPMTGLDPAYIETVMSTTEKNINYQSDTSHPIELLIDSQLKDLGEFVVRRTLPTRDRQRVGPFIFFDHMGPADFAPGTGVSVRPHPHIGLATVTYLFEGEIVHRDSLGCVQPIRPGAVNWMTAGQGIVHSERSPEDMMAAGSRLHGLQTWLALPTELEETDASFDHYPASDIPVVALPGASVSVLVGSAYGEKSPVVTSSETLYLAADLTAGATLDVAADTEERAIYVAGGELSLDGNRLEIGTMAVLKPGVVTQVEARQNSKAMILGGAPLEGKRYIYWNLVSSSRERIEKAKDDWRNDRFEKVPGETDFIPLPD